ncbi:hypothetical protein C8D70_11672 [Chryseobacterium sp. CBTAP 102]|uniref:hypothetical protein n=1 Tax=Chryseobacterium sp. CBTAP 102 TaxID=2135644 RepID=UPI000D7726AD|nr:hypothetical protein [Chryseobacterium sp. CBTAP 102]PXW09458.1 hypothetical protein C8D70_11672 [Chryseobacterium sp. CBTAP 102]
MKKTIFSAVLFLSITAIYHAQSTGFVGINTTTPRTTLDVTASNDPTKSDGVLVPRMTTAQLESKNTAYDIAQNGTLVFVTSGTGTPSTKTELITQSGFYYYDATTSRWTPLKSFAVPPSSTTASNGLSMVGTDVQLGGTLNKDTNIAGSNKLTFSAPLQVTSGTPGAGKVLTSDATGNATWGTLPAATVTTANNGLTMNGTTTQLGGALTQATNITGASRLTLATPTTVSGALQISSGTPGAGKILTSDATGNATWGTLPAATVTTANNGLTMNGTTTQLGGTLTQATNITGASRLTLATPTTVSGALQISSGTPGAGKILTSDASGNASWEQPNVFRTPLFPNSSGFSYNGPLVSGINSGISITLPPNSTWIIHIQQLIRFNRALKVYQSGTNILSEGVWVRFHWSDSTNGNASSDILAGRLISAACYPGPNYHMLNGETIIKNNSAVSKSYYLTTATIDTASLDTTNPITFNGLFFAWSENTLYALPSNN